LAGFVRRFLHIADAIDGDFVASRRKIPRAFLERGKFPTLFQRYYDVGREVIREGAVEFRLSGRQSRMRDHGCAMHGQRESSKRHPGTENDRFLGGRRSGKQGGYPDETQKLVEQVHEACVAVLQPEGKPRAGRHGRNP
jgi:hypothetical protein